MSTPITEWPLIDRGDTWRWVGTLETEPATSLLSVQKLWLTLKRRVSDSYENAAVKLTDDPDGGIIVLSSAQLSLEISEAVTRTLKAGDYFIDIQALTAEGDVTTFSTPKTIRCSDDVSDPLIP